MAAAAGAGEAGGLPGPGVLLPVPLIAGGLGLGPPPVFNELFIYAFAFSILAKLKQIIQYNIIIASKLGQKFY